ACCRFGLWNAPSGRLGETISRPSLCFISTPGNSIPSRSACRLAGLAGSAHMWGLGAAAVAWIPSWAGIALHAPWMLPSGSATFPPLCRRSAWLNEYRGRRRIAVRPTPKDWRVRQSWAFSQTPHQGMAPFPAASLSHRSEAVEEHEECGGMSDARVLLV